MKNMVTAVNVKAAGGCSQEWAGEKLDMASQPTHSCADKGWKQHLEKKGIPDRKVQASQTVTNKDR